MFRNITTRLVVPLLYGNEWFRVKRYYAYVKEFNLDNIIIVLLDNESNIKITHQIPNDSDYGLLYNDIRKILSGKYSKISQEGKWNIYLSGTSDYRYVSFRKSDLISFAKSLCPCYDRKGYETWRDVETYNNIINLGEILSKPRKKEEMFNS